ncbi:MAG TPA: tail fiber protein [Bryobacteraceae bacterium]|nr:tail fiber protein [Bryobacteraceae bacterium]
MFGGNFAPTGWALCNGQLLPISQNTALFSILGTTFGGDGISTFALPDLRGRVTVHQGQGPGLSPYTIGQSAGTENVTLLSSQMPAHNHVINATESATTSDPAGAVPANEAANRTMIYGATPDGTVMNAAMCGNAGGSQPHSNIQPYLCVTFIIALQGIFPSRN